MNGRVLVVCASRDRNLALQRMLDSVHRTSTQADVAVYIDDDQAQDYQHIRGASLVVGERIGPVNSLNKLVETFPGYEAYGAATDDSAFETPNWDRWVLETAERWPVSVMAPKLRGSQRMDFPWATARWIETVGWFAYPSCYHSYWDVLLELMGEATRITYARESEFAMSHDDAPSPNLQTHALQDAYNVVGAIALWRPGLIHKLKAAMLETVS